MNASIPVTLAYAGSVVVVDTLPLVPDALWARAPYFASLLFVVIGFAWFLEKRDKRSSEALEERDRELMIYVKTRDEDISATIKTLNLECHVIQQASIESLRANTEMLGKIAGVLLAMGSVAADQRKQ